MQQNPYKYHGPLDPDKDRSVFIERSSESGEVISGIMRGEYWTILGPRQIGKTTFLNQLINELAAYICLYFDMEVCPDTDQQFYDWLIDRISDQMLEAGAKINLKNGKDFGPEIKFYDFLKSIEIRSSNKIIFFFDEIEKTPSVKSFLHLWRKVFNERSFRAELEKFGVVIAGSVDLIALTVGPTSPFNISKKLYLKELSEHYARRLIIDPMKQLELKLDPEAIDELILRTSGHPQLLQHLCYLLVASAAETDRSITKSQIQGCIDTLFIASDNLSALRQEIQMNGRLAELIKNILSGEKIHFLPHQEFNIAGVGPIVKSGEFCAIRNRIYEEFLRKIINLDCSDDHEVAKNCYVMYIKSRDFSQINWATESEEFILRHLF